MTVSEVVEVEGHIIDSLILAKVLDVIVDAGADYEMLDVSIGRTSVDPSRARLEVTAIDDDALAALLAELQIHGANRVDQSDAQVEPAEVDGVLPTGFYSTTNLPTQVRLGGHWVDVDNPEMDCALVVRPDGRVRTVPMHRVHAGDPVVVGRGGVRVHALDRPRGSTPFEFMNSEVSSEKPKEQLVARVADRIRAAKARGRKVLAVCGPAVIHTGAGPDVAALVRGGIIDVLFAGTASPPTTSSRTCSAPRSASPSATTCRPKEATATTSASSTRSGATARSPPQSRPGTSPAG
jgi:lysine-ketoglutarate reductase/saccharopine dehydrogenase-like protein (TIGR00300 family)